VGFSKKSKIDEGGDGLGEGKNGPRKGRSFETWHVVRAVFRAQRAGSIGG